MYINEVNNPRDLASLLGIEYSYLTYILYHKRPEKSYILFDIPKRSGEKRTINAPIPPLKYVQRRLADVLWDYELYLRNITGVDSKISHAFEKDKSIFTNAFIHKHKKYIINIDLKDYFNCFHFGRVKGFFIKNRNYQLPDSVATIIAQLTCYNGCLPQGAPTSPIISNLISNILDMKLLRVAKQYKLDYTRYADDLTFSTNDKRIIEKFDSFLECVNEIVEKSGFSININKTRFQYYSSRQIVTGLVVNKKLNINSHYFRATKAMAFSLYTKGEFFIGSEKGNIPQLEGRFSFINQIDKYNNKLACKKEKRTYRNLNNREEQYRRFLFFKYFYNNSKPLIVTEGKTDVVYIKAALKNLYADYPELVYKKDGCLRYKISFLKRSNLLEYLFGFGKDGADAMKNLYNFFAGKNGFKNYHQYFQKYSNHKAHNPVIFVFDNELNNSQKPLKNFISHVNLKPDQTDKFIKNHFISIEKDSNLFLLTHQLVCEKNECEIEDLFEKELTEMKLNGKEFDRSGKKDNNKFYSKEIFSRYVMSHYQEINFEQFKPMLETIKAVIISYKKQTNDNPI